jgi:hypothetical protein
MCSFFDAQFTPEKYEKRIEARRQFILVTWKEHKAHVTNRNDVDDFRLLVELVQPSHGGSASVMLARSGNDSIERRSD